MKFRDLFLGTVLGLGLSGQVFAAPFVVTGDDTWVGDRDFSNNGDTAYGISSNGVTGIITTDGDVTSNANLHGIYSQSGGKITFEGIGTNTIQTNDNKNATGTDGKGIFATGTGSEININNMNIEVNENGLHGVFAETEGKINITGVANGSNWLRANGNKNAAATDGKGIFARTASQINISNMNIESTNARVGIYSYQVDTEINITNSNLNISNNVVYGIVAGSGGKMTIIGNGNNKLITNNNGDGIHCSNVDSPFIHIENMDIEVSGNSRTGIRATNGYGKIEIIGISSRNNLILKNNVEGIYVSYNAEIDIANMNIFAKENDVFNISNNGIIKIDNSSVFINDASKLVVFSNLGTNGTFTAADSDIMGAMFTDSAAGATSNVTLSDTIWRSIGRSNITNYVASNADLFMSVMFDAASSGDRLTIEGSSTGDTTLHVASAGTDGSQSEVLVVDQSLVSAGNANATFDLFGNVVDSGAFEYTLFQGSQDGDIGKSNNWYLRSTGVMTNTAKVIANIPAVNIHIAKAGMNELRKRMGELRDNDPSHQNGAWVRTYAKNLKVDESIDSKMNIFGFEAGYDHQVYGDCDDKVYAGIMAGYSYTDNIRTRNTRGMNGSGHANTPTIGAYATWMNYDGWFADATLRSFWTNMDMTAYTSQGEPIVFDVDRQFTAGSIEAGRQLAWDIDSYSKWILEPKAEFSYIYGKAKSFNTKSAVLGNKIHYGSTDSIQARAALMAGYNTELENGSIIQPFVQAAVIQEFGGVTDINFAGADYKSDISGTSCEIGTGLNAKIDDNWSFYGDVMYEFGNVIQALSTNIGVRYNF